MSFFFNKQKRNTNSFKLCSLNPQSVSTKKKNYKQLETNNKIKTKKISQKLIIMIIFHLRNSEKIRLLLILLESKEYDMENGCRGQ